MRLPINAARLILLWPNYCLLLEKNVMEDLNAILSPGMFVQHPDQPDWGTGQVQSNVNARVTVNFRDQGKVVIDSTRVALVPIFDE